MPPAAALVVLPACAEQNTARKPRWLDPVRGRGVASYIDAMRRAHTLSLQLVHSLVLYGLHREVLTDSLELVTHELVVLFLRPLALHVQQRPLGSDGRRGQQEGVQRKQK